MKKIMIENNLLKKIWIYIFFGIILFGAFLRFYNVPDRYGFDYDATYDVIVAYVSAKDLQLPLTGNFSSAGAFTFGPWYYYHLIFFQIFTNLEYGPWLLNGILSLVTIGVMFLVGRKVLDIGFGLLLALLTAVSPSQIVIGSMSSNPNIVALYSSLAFLVFVKIIKGSKNLWWAFLWGMFLGIAINAHYQAMNLLVFLIFLVIYTPYRKIMTLIVSLAGLVVSFLPLLFFNLTNNWHTVRNFIHYSLYGKDKVYVPNSWTIYMRDFWPEIFTGTFGIPYAVTFIFAGIMAGVLGYLLYKKKLSSILIISIIYMGITFIYMRYYWGERHFVYYYYLYPILFLLVGYSIYVFRNVKNGILTILLTGLLVMFGLISDVQHLEDGNYSYIKNQAENIKKMYPNKNVSLYVCEHDDQTRANAIAYLLDRSNVIGRNEDIKLGFPGKYCTFPSHSTFSQFVATPSAEVLHTIYPIKKEFDGYDFTNASVSALLNANWKSVNVEDVYNSEVRWWFDEQP